MPETRQGGVPDTQGSTLPTGDGADPNGASDGGDQTRGNPPAGDRWTDERFRKGQLSQKFQSGYESGRTKAERDLLARYGVSSFDELDSIVKGDGPAQPGDAADEVDVAEPEPVVDDASAAATPQQAAAPAQQGAVVTARMRAAQASAKQAQAELARVQRRTTEEKKRLEAEVGRLKVLADASLRSELKSRLVLANAHEGVDQLVKLIVDVDHLLQWSDDGRRIEAYHEQGGRLVPNGMSIDEFVEELAGKPEYAHFFKSKGVQGSGSIPDARPVDADASSQAGWSFEKNLAAWRRRRASGG